MSRDPTHRPGTRRSDAHRSDTHRSDTHRPDAQREHLHALIEGAWSKRHDEPGIALAMSEEALRVAREHDEPHELTLALRTHAACLLLRGRPHDADATLTEAHARTTERTDPELRAELHSLTLQAKFYRGDPHAALEHGTKALRLAEELADSTRLARAHNELGLLHANHGNHEDALEHLLASARIRETAGQPPLGAALNNIGNLYLMQDDPDNALGYFRAARDAFETAGFRRDVAIALGNIGRAHETSGNHAAALEAYSDSAERFERLGDPSYLAPALTRLGRLHANLGDRDRALELFERTQDLYDRHAGAAFRTETILPLAELRLELGDAHDAERLYRHALETAEARTERAALASAHEGLSRALEAQGDTRAALEHHRAYHALTREAQAETHSWRVTTLRARYELERAEHERDTAREQHAALQEAHAELERLHALLTEQAHELERLSTQDPLTGLANRRALDTRLTEELERARRYRTSVSLLLCDIDGFKDINDRLSHSTGDEVLRCIARVLRNGTRANDLVVRFGGEEFILILPETPIEAALATAEKLRAAVESHDWADITPELRVTLSFGVVSSDGNDAPHALIDRADARLYEAKRDGRNRVCCS